MNERVARDAEVELNAEVRKYFEDEIYDSALNIPTSEIDNFIYFCELDTAFITKVKAKDQLLLLDFIKLKSVLFKKQNGLE